MVETPRTWADLSTDERLEEMHDKAEALRVAAEDHKAALDQLDTAERYFVETEKRLRNAQDVMTGLVEEWNTPDPKLL